MKLEYEDHTVVHPGLLVLGDAFSYPHQIPYFLLPQPHVSEEDGIMELQLKQIQLSTNQQIGLQ